MERFALLTNHTKDKNRVFTRMVADYIEKCGKAYWIAPNIASDKDTRGRYDLGDMPQDIDCVLALGGDGTLLQVARAVLDKNIPVMGINIGTLGFLTAAERSELPYCLDALFEGRFRIEERMMAEASLCRGGKRLTKDIALNDVTINRSGFSRLIELKIYVDEQLLSIYNADGIIVSTPTGSTGYNLSAGGPVVAPLTDVMIITPICPHSLQARSIVVSGDSKIRVEIGRRHKTQKEEGMITFDGQVAMDLEPGDYIEINKAHRTTRLIQLEDRNFYQILRNKIGNA